MDSSEVTCKGVRSCVGRSFSSPSQCQFKRKLCVSCHKDNNDTVIIRIQTNGLPDHCWSSSRPLKQVHIDFEVAWNSPNRPKYTHSMLYGQHEVDSVLCSPLSHSAAHFPRHIYFHNFTDSKILERVSGVARNGVLILSPANAHKRDGLEATNLDECLGAVDSTSGFYFYRSLSPCMFNREHYRGRSACKKPKCQPWQVMLHHMPHRPKGVGVSKDGRVILSPYSSSGELWARKGIDVCNTKTVYVDKHHFFDEGSGQFALYAYLGSPIFPYISGCFAEGTFPLKTPSCTDHGPRRYIRKNERKKKSNKGRDTIIGLSNYKK